MRKILLLYLNTKSCSINLSSIYVNLNVPVKNTNREVQYYGTKDDFGFKFIFLPLKKMSEDSGPLYYYEMKKNNLGVFHKYLRSIKSAKKVNKININSFENVNEQNISKFIGDVGDNFSLIVSVVTNFEGFVIRRKTYDENSIYQTPDS